MNFDARVNTIFCDMDGVLVDFDAFKKKHLSAEAQDDDSVMWPEIARIPNFYRKLKPTVYARQLWAAIKLVGSDRCILTAIPRVTTIPTAADDKRLWVTDHRAPIFGGERPAVNIGPHSRDKYKHIKYEGDIIIDDRADNIQQWIDAGGIGILHTGDVDRTILMLHEATGLLL